jgi:2-methylisocitrate lyase-like PEP mutase family enzyme
MPGKIVLTVQIPVFADADTGYGDAILPLLQ